MLYIILKCISHLFKITLLAAYFIFILDCRVDVRQKADSSDFLIQVQNEW